jgi:hypothetical protein
MIETIHGDILNFKFNKIRREKTYEEQSPGIFPEQSEEKRSGIFHEQSREKNQDPKNVRFKNKDKFDLIPTKISKKGNILLWGLRHLVIFNIFIAFHNEFLFNLFFSWNLFLLEKFLVIILLKYLLDENFVRMNLLVKKIQANSFEAIRTQKKFRYLIKILQNNDILGLWVKKISFRTDETPLKIVGVLYFFTEFYC